MLSLSLIRRCRSNYVPREGRRGTPVVRHIEKERASRNHSGFLLVLSLIFLRKFSLSLSPSAFLNSKVKRWGRGRMVWGCCRPFSPKSWLSLFARTLRPRKILRVHFILIYTHISMWVSKTSEISRFYNHNSMAFLHVSPKVTPSFYSLVDILVSIVPNSFFFLKFHQILAKKKIECQLLSSSLNQTFFEMLSL